MSEEKSYKPAVLVVEDSPTVLAVIQKALECDDYEVINAKSGAEAIAAANRPELFLIILDVSLPDMSGFEVAEALKKQGKSEATPLIFLTAMDPQNELTFRGYQAGAVDFIYKPAHPQVLLSKARIFFDLYEKGKQIRWQLEELEDTNRRFSQELRERRRMEMAVQESEVRYRSLLELSPVSIVVEVDNKLSYINTAVLKLLGEEDREAVVQHSLLDYVTDRHKEETSKRIARVLGQGGRAEPFETQFARRDGSTVDVEVYAACVMYEGSIGVQMALQDITERKLLEAEWRRLSRMDGLTGIFNRRAFDEIIERELRRAQRANEPLSLALIDIDAFKLFNDHYGHQGGDDTLKRVAGALRETAGRGGDHVARYGGEEFAVVMASTPAEGAMHMAEQLRAAVEGLGIPHERNPAGPVVTISLGVLTLTPGDSVTPASMVEAADKCLYRAKNEGRNRAVTITAE
ncbi:MAG: diguanylate cyclase [Candidatus Hydrogenedens sp.]|nr:diguanylate cyclase [Candidatus Hydrogenedens sp.]